MSWELVAQIVVLMIVACIVGGATLGSVLKALSEHADRADERLAAWDNRNNREGQTRSTTIKDPR
jgi:hypothetical protein